MYVGTFVCAYGVGYVLIYLTLTSIHVLAYYNYAVYHVAGCMDRNLQFQHAVSLQQHGFCYFTLIKATREGRRKKKKEEAVPPSLIFGLFSCVHSMMGDISTLL